MGTRRSAASREVHQLGLGGVSAATRLLSARRYARLSLATTTRARSSGRQRTSAGSPQLLPAATRGPRCGDLARARRRGARRRCRSSAASPARRGQHGRPAPPAPAQARCAEQIQPGGRPPSRTARPAAVLDLHEPGLLQALDRLADRVPVDRERDRQRALRRQRVARPRKRPARTASRSCTSTVSPDRLARDRREVHRWHPAYRGSHRSADQEVGPITCRTCRGFGALATCCSPAQACGGVQDVINRTGGGSGVAAQHRGDRPASDFGRRQPRDR